MTLGDLAEDAETLVKEFVDNTVFGLGLQIFKSVLVAQLALVKSYAMYPNLDDERSRFVARKRCPLPLQRFIDAKWLCS